MTNITEDLVKKDYPFYYSLTNPVKKQVKGGESVVGFEFENETKAPDPFPDLLHWKYHEEGSLKHCGFELVSSSSLNEKNVEERVVSLFKQLKEAVKSPFTNSLRTSTHIHFDFRGKNFLRTTAFCLAYWMLEPFIQYYCGLHRQYNHFCLRYQDAKNPKYSLLAFFKGKTNPLFQHSVFSDNYRYSSLNLQALAKFGSIESRLMRGVDNAEDALIWYNTLKRIKDFTDTFNTPLKLRTFFVVSSSPTAFAKEILGETLFSLHEDYFPNDLSIDQEIRKNYLSLLDIFQETSIYTDETIEKIGEFVSNLS